MKKFSQDLLRSAIPHFIAIIVFAVVAYVYCRPAFENKVLEQEDVLQWQAMAHNSFKYKEIHGHFPLWSNGMFSGMPAYQIAMDSQSVSIPNMFYGLLTLFLVKPASFFFLACICFYFLAGVLRVTPFVAVIGALAYAYGTYNAVIISVGHDTKMQSIALMPGVIGALILICERKYWLGIVLTSLFSALMVAFNHIQIVYYTMIIAGGLLLGYGIPWLRWGEGRLFGRTLLLVLGASFIGILSNAVSLFTSYDSSKESIRGGSELADAKSNYTQEGLSEHAAFDFSMYKTEPFVMFIPDIYGGSSDLQLPASRSKATQVYRKMPRMLADQVGMDGPKYYWGGVGDLFSGPPYVGAVIILLALAGFFILHNPKPTEEALDISRLPGFDKSPAANFGPNHKWWILGICILTIIMSWGGYFQTFNGLLLKYLPMYNKFRAPSMILVVPSFLLCVMATLTLQRLVSAGDRKQLWRQFGRGLLLVAGIFGLLMLFYFRFNYSSPNDVDLMIKARSFGKSGEEMMAAFISGLQSDRQHLYAHSLLRTGGIVLIAAVLITAFIRKKFPSAVFLALLGGLAFADLISIDLKYLNDDNYKEREAYEQNFAGTRADSTILTDKTYYRVFDIRDSVANALTYGAMTAYFHQSIGGYHAARLKIYEDLINRQLYNYPNCSPVLDMLNAKYIIRAVRGGGDTVIPNKGNLGPVWFAGSVRFEGTPKEVMDDLTWFDPKQTAILFSADSAKVRPPDTVKTKNDTAMIKLVSNENDEVNYLSQSNHRQFAVFSEIFYKRGWRAWIDDKEVPIIRTNYVLRGLSVPAGRHVIRFFFRPLSYYLGRQIQWMASIIFLLMVAGAIIVALREYPFPFRKVVSSPEKCEPLSSAYHMPRSPLKE